MLRNNLYVICAAVFLTAFSRQADALTSRTLNTNGAWCWYQDERALVSDSLLVFASITSTGTVEITSCDLSTMDHTITPIRTNFTADDHNVAALLHRNDGHFMAFYAKHHADNKMHIRVSDRPNDATSWSAERSFTFGIPNHATYANPFQLSSEDGRIYLFWRGLNFWPTYSFSDDGGTSWSRAANIIADALGNKNTRPYVKYCSNGTDTIHLAYTDAHPRNLSTNSIYHVYYRDGNVYKSDGTLLRALSSGPILTTQGTKVYDGAGPAGKGWIWDMALDKTQNPVMVYATFPSKSDPISDHRYRYAKWNPATSSWFEKEIAHAGTGLYPVESEYSGGICVDPDDTSIVYFSANVDPATGLTTGTGKREIYQGKTPDGGRTWTWRALTSNSEQNNIRPIVPANHPPGIFVLWMQGRFDTYSDYGTHIVLATEHPGNK